MALLEVEGITKIFTQRKKPPHIVLENMSFTVERGQYVSLLGPSGCGKTTLLTMMGGFLTPDAGEIILAGNKVEKPGPDRGFVFQNYALFPWMTVKENVLYSLQVKKLSKQEQNKRLHELLEISHLFGSENKYPVQLSGGMQQRVGIARALVQNADLLLLDEPFSGLDPLIRREMQDELLRLQAELKKTMVFVTHDLNEALRLGDRMAVMKQGLFVQEGTPRDIVMNPADEYVQRFVQNEKQISLLTETAEEKKKVSNLTPLIGGKKGKIAAGSGR